MSSEQPAPINSSMCLESAARILRFAETEDHPSRFDQYMSLAGSWMELAEHVRENSNQL